MNNLNPHLTQSQRITTQIGPKGPLKEKINLFNAQNKDGAYNIMDSQQRHFHITRMTLDGEVKSKTPIYKEKVIGFEDEHTIGLKGETPSLDNEISSVVMSPLVRHREIKVDNESKN